MFKRYFENTRHFRCPECGNDFTLSFWQWFFALFHDHITKHSYVHCPHCGARHWLKAIKMVE